MDGEKNDSMTKSHCLIEKRKFETIESSQDDWSCKKSCFEAIDLDRESPSSYPQADSVLSDGCDSQGIQLPHNKQHINELNCLDEINSNLIIPNSGESQEKIDNFNLQSSSNPESLDIYTNSDPQENNDKESDNLNTELSNNNLSDLHMDSNSSNDNKPSTSNAQIVREKCRYGEKCYRKNLEHRQKFSHPGDDDYDVPDNRPKCPYGLQCYRKNPQHKQDYKHVKLRREDRKRTSRKQVYDFSDSEESVEESVDESGSEYEPSFISDESTDESVSDEF